MLDWLSTATQPTRPSGSLLISPNQINVVGQAGATTTQDLSLTNTGSAATVVGLSSRALTDKVYDSGVNQFTIDPVKPTTNTGTFPIWSGVTEIYQTEDFTVPASSSSRLVFSADYQNTHQTSLLHFALFEPNGSYAAYSDPQGLGDYGEVEVANPPAGKWTALFFTEQDGAPKVARDEGHGAMGRQRMALCDHFDGQPLDADRRPRQDGRSDDIHHQPSIGGRLR